MDNSTMSGEDGSGFDCVGNETLGATLEALRDHARSVNEEWAARLDRPLLFFFKSK